MKQQTMTLQGAFRKISHDRMYYIMFAPVFIFAILFCYLPMIGVLLAFFDFTPFKFKFVGFTNFIDLFFGIRSVNFWRSVYNTIFLSLSNLVLGTLISVSIALLLNEIESRKFKSFIQSILYLPHFLSWVVVASIFTIILSPQGGLINNFLSSMGYERIYFLAEETWWTPIYLFIGRWKETGWGTIIYLAALSGINPELYEAAEIDGAGKWKQALYITLPSLVPTIIIVFVLNLGKVLNIFESVFVLMNSNVLKVSDVISVFAYRTGIQQANYGMGTAIGLFRSFIGMILVLMTNKINEKIRGSSIF
ncbi:ABC transporter permease [Gracilinema caldarium]|uniref:ABC-type transporter, integral membrane subunit n=1 Tax=Gracilinema caldarium (strain ATCC 51460 / DSM 7334 / H1) TaxID=744872 RepID=F8F4B4_GRAC1|nr:ABC transporter permease subunit [Gracilinema caldarium]AEJ20561.1 ABC-type transporter, integral membrane subunit [Gracilinema caldarium DSM 7334]